VSVYQPPFQLNHAMLSKVAEIAEWLGPSVSAWEGGYSLPTWLESGKNEVSALILCFWREGQVSQVHLTPMLR
jgi:hypothetical protein